MFAIRVASLCLLLSGVAAFQLPLPLPATPRVGSTTTEISSYLDSLTTSSDAASCPHASAASAPASTLYTPPPATISFEEPIPVGNYLESLSPPSTGCPHAATANVNYERCCDLRCERSPAGN